MPHYLVRFPAPVTYLAGHRAERLITELAVHAPKPEAALTHAVRVVTGEVDGATVEPYEPDAVPPVYEAPQDLQQNFPLG